MTTTLASPPLDVQAMDNGNLAAALRLASLGVSVFPCGPDKKPRLGVFWRKAATTDTATIEGWWRRRPDSVPAFEPGAQPMPMVVIDCDRHGGPDGVAAFAELARRYEDDPRDWPTVETPSTGRHIFFANPAKLTNARGALPDGIDVRGSGGYVVAEGATLPDGRAYAAPAGFSGICDSLEAGALPMLPGWLAALLTAPKEIEAPAGNVTVLAPSNADARGAAIAEKALAEDIAALASTTGNRNNGVNGLAYRLGRMVAAGWIDRATVESRLEQACAANGLWKDDGPRQCRATIKSGLDNGMQAGSPPLAERETPSVVINLPVADGRDLPQGDASAREITTKCAADLAGMPVQPRRWHAEGLIPGRNVTLLTGDGGTGKSLLALQLAVATATGMPWIGIDVQAAPSLFLTAEDEIDELHRRLHDIAFADGIGLAKMTNLHLASLAGEDAVLGGVNGREGIVRPTALFAAVQSRARAIGARLVILDTLADLFSGDENQRSQARQFVGLLRGLAMDLDAAVILLSHPSLSGMGSGSGTSGNTAWSNSVRSRLYLDRITTEEGKRVVEDDPDARRLQTKKANYGRTGGEIRLRWADGRFMRMDIPAGGGLGEVAAKAKAERIFRELLAAFSDEGRTVSAARSANYAPAVFASDPRADGISKRQLEAAMNRLFAAREITVSEVGPPSKRRKSLVFRPSGEG